MTTQPDLFAPYKPLSQKERVRIALTMAGAGGICISDLPLELSYAARNRIGELRREGYAINSSTCHRHKHRSAVARYVLVGR
jgi:hypothetical protein